MDKFLKHNIPSSTTEISAKHNKYAEGNYSTSSNLIVLPTPNRIVVRLGWCLDNIDVSKSEIDTIKTSNYISVMVDESTDIK